MEVVVVVVAGSGGISAAGCRGKTGAGGEVARGVVSITVAGGRLMVDAEEVTDRRMVVVESRDEVVHVVADAVMIGIQGDVDVGEAGVGGSMSVSVVSASQANLL